jgi:hypothetical protein
MERQLIFETKYCFLIELIELKFLKIKNGKENTHLNQKECNIIYHFNKRMRSCITKWALGNIIHQRNEISNIFG